jgi:hypothetical protein
MAWYIAKSLETLRHQLNTIAPNRSTKSDGGIGDAAHSARLSDHNPTSSGQVCARDFTNDPAGGCGGQWLADALVRSRDPRIKYIIWNHRIIDSRAGSRPWQWVPYSGENAHEHHVHVSVFAGALGDDTRPWSLGTAGKADNDMTPQEFLDTRVTWWDGKSAPVKDILAEVYLASKGLRGAPAFDKQPPVALPALAMMQSKLDALTAQVAALTKALEAKS